MNLNHIAKKPFLDAFYIKPNMHHFLRAAMFDSGSKINGTVGPQGLIRFNSEI
jgi:hypothetical protein